MSTVATAFDFDKARFNMIEQQIRPWNVLDAQVLSLLGEDRRELFVAPEHQLLAMADLSLPLSHPAVEGECMLPPKAEARCLQDLALQPGEHVLEIGTGSGHMAALLGQQCGRVLSLEINPALAEQARRRLAQSGRHNVEVRTADAAAQGFAACTSAAPYDAIVLSGSVEQVPAELLALLKVGGRLFAFVGDEPMMRATLVRRLAADRFHEEQPWDFVAPRLRNFPTASGFQF